jgi:hypothetical protein
MYDTSKPKRIFKVSFMKYTVTAHLSCFQSVINFCLFMQYLNDSEKRVEGRGEGFQVNNVTGDSL